MLRGSLKHFQSACLCTARRTWPSPLHCKAHLAITFALQGALGHHLCTARRTWPSPLHRKAHLAITFALQGTLGHHSKSFHTIACRYLPSRCRQFPSLINCTTIDWYSRWPREALLSVAGRYLAGTDLGGQKVGVQGAVCADGQAGRMLHGPSKHAFGQ
jgi:hypothetical protein